MELQPLVGQTERSGHPCSLVLHFVCGSCRDGDVGPFAAALHVLFAIEADARRTESAPHQTVACAAVCGIDPRISQQVQHHGGAVLARRNQRQAHGGSHLQVELARSQASMGSGRCCADVAPFR